jgi:RimJ/RimL family protein N-acetyltransferase
VANTQRKGKQRRAGRILPAAPKLLDIIDNRKRRRGRERLCRTPKMQRETFELQPHLVGELIELRPLIPDDWEILFAVASDPLIWEQHPARDRYKKEVFEAFFREALESDGAFAVIDRKTQKVIGSSRYFEYDPVKSEIEIGWTFLARPYWGGKYNAELKRLMLDHAFKFVKRVLFMVGPTNFRSQKALEKIGAVAIGRRERTNQRGDTIVDVVYQIERT